VCVFLQCRPIDHQVMTVMHAPAIHAKITKLYNKIWKHQIFQNGDLNLPKINWLNFSGSGDATHQKFLSFLIKSSYEQLVTFPTRNCNILDVILTNMLSLFGMVNADTPLSTSDHSSVKFELVFDSRCCCISPCSTGGLIPVPNVKYKWH